MPSSHISATPNLTPTQAQELIRQPHRVLLALGLDNLNEPPSSTSLHPQPQLEAAPSDMLHCSLRPWFEPTPQPERTPIPTPTPETSGALECVEACVGVRMLHGMRNHTNTCPPIESTLHTPAPCPASPPHALPFPLPRLASRIMCAAFKTSGNIWTRSFIMVGT